MGALLSLLSRVKSHPDVAVLLTVSHRPEPERQPEICNVNIQFNTHEEAHKNCHYKSPSSNMTEPRLTHDIVRWELLSAVRSCGCSDDL